MKLVLTDQELPCESATVHLLDPRDNVESSISVNVIPPDAKVLKESLSTACVYVYSWGGDLFLQVYTPGQRGCPTYDIMVAAKECFACKEDERRCLDKNGNCPVRRRIEKANREFDEGREG